MTREEKEARFEELDAGRALGDLDAEEIAEWDELSAFLGRKPDPLLDRLVGELEAGSPAAIFPAGLAARLVPGPRGRPRLRVVAWAGWALAACLLGLLALRKEETPRMVPSAVESREALLREESQALRLPFAGTVGEFALAEGEVIWSDARQEGYLTLSHIPSNDPGESQYQLWIVDPSRDEFPVDGGVFNIGSSAGPIVIPIDAKLPVRAPAAFVITEEKPGGVVRSKQEIVVAVAKR
jgi:hypothetical protein